MPKASLVAAFALGVAVSVATFATASSKRFEKLDVFARVLAHVEQSYVEEVDEAKLVYGAAKGMVRTLDPHSDFLTPEEYRDMRADTEGEFGGVGVEVQDDDGVIVIVEPIVGSPAARAGLRAGDRVVAIDGAPTKGRTTPGRLRGKPGTTVVLDVSRPSWPEPHRITLARELIHVPAVDSALLEPGLGYLRLKQFQERADEEAAAALAKLESQSGGRLHGLILDLRGNPGGLLDQAVKVSDLFLSSGVIVTTMGRGGKKVDEEVAKSHGTWDSFPIACLVNGETASAAEIVAGALQDHGRAVVVGTQTFGKGSVQSLFDLGDGSGLKLTVARYYTPSGRSIQERGITPDLIVDAADSAKATEKRERDLDGHLTNEQPAPSPPVAADRLAKDNQLRAAVQMLKTWQRFGAHRARLDTPSAER